MTWAEYEDVWVDKDRVSGAPCLKGTRVPVDAILDNFDGFSEEGLTPGEAELAVLACYPHVSVERIHRLVAFRDEHESELYQ